MPLGRTTAIIAALSLVSVVMAPAALAACNVVACAEASWISGTAYGDHWASTGVNSGNGELTVPGTNVWDNCSFSAGEHCGTDSVGWDTTGYCYARAHTDSGGYEVTHQADRCSSLSASLGGFSVAP